MDSDNKNSQNEDVFSKVVKAGKRTYFFDVKETRSGENYLIITESKKITEDDGNVFFKKHRIHLYKEDLDEFQDSLEETLNFVRKNNSR